MNEKSIVLDTSILFYISEYKFDIFLKVDEIIQRPYFYIIPTPVLNEIKKISKNEGKTGTKAKVSLLLIDKHKDLIKYENSTKKADDAVLEIAKQNLSYVATADKLLKRRAKGLNLLVLVPSGKRLSIF